LNIRDEKQTTYRLSTIYQNIIYNYIGRLWEPAKKFQISCVSVCVIKF